MIHLKSAFRFFALLQLCLFMTAGFALAQPPGDAAGGQAGTGQMQGAPTGQQGGRGGMQMDQGQRQQMMVERYQEILGMSDEEWAVIGPYVLKVYTLSSSSQSRGTTMRTQMGSRNNRQQDTQTQAQDQSTNQSQRSRNTARGSQDENLQALETLLEDENATTDEIKAKLSAVRKARETAKQELAVAQKELRETLTLRQEAMLVVMGLLE